MKRSTAPSVRGSGLLALCLWLGAGTAVGQERNRVTEIGIPYSTTVRVPQGGLVSLRPFLVRGSFVAELEGTPVPARGFVLDEATGAVRFLPETVPPGSVVRMSYRAFALGIQPISRLARVPSGEDAVTASSMRPLPVDVPSTHGLRSRGSVSRGVIAGSGRDPAIESGLRLEVDGSPAPGVQVTAALTDETLPIRPDGSTQRIDEFDRIAITVAVPAATVMLGDFDLGLQGSRFARFQRKVQGVGVDARYARDAGPGGAMRAAGAAAKGEFRVQTIRPIDGVQGPYRLEGASGERFLLVVPGSDVVWLDGVRLERGDGYTIDYSTGEIHFGPRVPISSDRRITAEFSYSLDRFTRTLVASEATAFAWRDARAEPRIVVGATVIREADSDDFAGEFGLSTEDSLAIALAGDGIAVRSGAVAVPFDPEAPYVQYRVRSIGADSLFEALDSPPRPGETVYRVSFSRVEEGTGSYRRAGTSVNGIVYSWEPGSDYEPVRRLPVPRSKQIVDLRATLRPTPRLALSGEWAHSVVDRNRMSNLGGVEDAGSAAQAEVRWKSAGTGGFEAWIRRGRVGPSFSAFERIRPVEFARDWNLGVAADLAGSLAVGSEDDTEAGIRWTPRDSLSVAARIQRLSLSDRYSGLRWSAGLRHTAPDRIRWRWQGSGLRSDDRSTGTEGSVMEHRVRIEGPERLPVQPALEAEFEDRVRRDDGGSLSIESIRSIELRPSLARTMGRAALLATAEFRDEAWPSGSERVRAATSWTGTGSVRYSGDWAGGVTWGWRSRSMTDAGEQLPGAGDTRAVLVRTDLEGRPVPGVSVSWRYDAATERTPTLQEVYFRTGPERGEYVWVDANGDGLIQLDEFLPETTPDEGLYVRTFLPSDSLAAVATVRARLSLSTDADRRRPWQVRSVVEIEERSTTNRRADVYLLRLGSFRREGTTVDGRVRVRNDFSWRAPGTSFSADAAWTVLRSLSGLAAGTERRGDDRLELRTGLRAAPRLDVRLEGRLESTANESTSFASRRFDIRTRAVAPGSTWRVSSGTELRASIEMARKTDRSGRRTATVVRLPVSARFARPGRGDLVLRTEWADVDLSGIATGLAGWELTEGRGPGRSWMWGATMQWDVGSGLQALLSYDGRAPAAGRTVHTGRVQLTARF